MMISEIFTHLRAGEQLHIEFCENQYANLLPTSSLTFEDGKWIETYLNCWAAADEGMGGCNCYSHPTWVRREVSRRTALSMIQQVVREEASASSRRQAEMEWLDSAIAGLAEQDAYAEQAELTQVIAADLRAVLASESREEAE